MTVMCSASEDHVQRYVDKITSSCVLLEEDLNYISLYTPPIALPTTKPKHKKPLGTPSHIFFSKEQVFFALVGIGWVLCFRDLEQMVWAALLVLLIVCYIVVQIVKKKNKSGIHHQNLNVLNLLLTSSEEIHAVMNKCLKFIQEMEIAAMGYTRITGTTPISRLERSKQTMSRQNMQLRCEALTSSVACILKCREATLKLLENNSLSVGNDVSPGMLICTIPVADLGPCFDKALSVEDLALATDNFCLDVLRDLGRLLFQQRSEFLRCLALSVQQKNTLEKLEILANAMSLIEDLIEGNKNATEGMKKSYDRHVNIQQDIIENEKDVKRRPSTTVKGPLYTSVHSLQVHLRAALNLAVQSENCISDRRSTIKETLLPRIKIHIDACGQCFADALVALNPKVEEGERNLGNSTPDVGRSVINEKTETTIDDSLLRPDDDFSEDQVFEGVTEYVEKAEAADDDDDDLQQNRKKRIEETVHVMKELKAVLHVKTSDHEREIRKTKLFPQYKPRAQPAPWQEDTNHEVVQSSDFPPDDVTTGEQQCITNNGSDGDPQNRISLCEIGPKKPGVCSDYKAGDAESNISGIASEHNILKVSRRPRPPGKTRRTHSHRVASDYSCEMPIRGQGIGGADGASEPNQDTGGPVPLGLGFSSALARQAASIARSSRIAPLSLPGVAALAGDEAIFGDSDQE